MDYEFAMRHVNRAVLEERERQNGLYGRQTHNHGEWLTIAIEEIGEAAQAIQREKSWGKETDADNLYEELIHSAAVIHAWAEQVLRDSEGNK